MTQQYDNRGQGVLFRNEEKRDDRDPDYRGSLTLQDGTECWLDAWLATAKKDGRKFMRLRYKPKMAREHAGASQNPPAQKAQQKSDFDSEIPF